MSLGSLALRGTIGPLFVGHGTQKLFGWFDGNGLEGTGGFFESLGLRPGRRHATAAGAAEALGGAMIAAGAATPVAAAALSGTMVTAIRKVHADNGPWTSQGGYEYNVVLLGGLVALTYAGPGRPSIDAARFPHFKGAALALGQLAAGIAGSYLITERLSRPEPGPAEGRADTPGDPAAAPEAPDRSSEGRFATDPASRPERPAPADEAGVGRS